MKMTKGGITFGPGTPAMRRAAATLGPDGLLPTFPTPHKDAERAAVIEECAREVERQIGTFSGTQGPDKRVDSALRLTAACVRSLAARPAPGDAKPPK
ncbi:MAG: hypothetical protein M3P32_07430 [Chloroflexota bacterium]|nr:hypothetical protein [Chloroflexota bacterium]